MNKRIKYRPYEWVPNEFLLQGIDGKNVNPAFEHFKSSSAGEVAGKGRRVELINAKFEPCN